MWTCPNCGEPIDYVDYSEPMVQYGRADLPNRRMEGNQHISSYIDYNYNDSDNNGDTTHHCPECDEEINVDDLVWCGPEPTIPAVRNRDGSIRPAIMEEVAHDIVHNSQGGRPSSVISSLNIKCPECGHDNLKLGIETFIECSECHNMINVNDVIQANLSH